MGFNKEPTGYIKAALSDLQGAWSELRMAVVENHPFKDSDKIIFHIDEGMSWESARHLKVMKQTLLLVSNTVQQSAAPGSVQDLIHPVREALNEVFESMKEGEIK
jgi:hypothetical protein